MMKELKDRSIFMSVSELAYANVPITVDTDAYNVLVECVSQQEQPDNTIKSVC